jgi:hypothetical protein
MTWLVAALGSAYVAWTGFALTSRVAALRRRFIVIGYDVNLDLPPATRTMFRVCTPAVVLPLTLTVIVVLVAKEIYLKEAAAKLFVSTFLILATAVVAAIVAETILRTVLAASTGAL